MSGQAERTKADRPYDYYVTVCGQCLYASCWHRTIMCEGSRSAGTKHFRADALDLLTDEHPSNYSVRRLTMITGQPPERIGAAP